jgi:hypothetical protein
LLLLQQKIEEAQSLTHAISGHGTLPVSISKTVQPRLHMSAGGPCGLALATYSENMPSGNAHNIGSHLARPNLIITFATK